MEVLLLVHLLATAGMVGVIWFVQVIHYPLFAKVGGASFEAYEQANTARTTRVVAPLMLTEAASAVLLLWLRPAPIPRSAAVAGVALVLMLWASTFFWQVPAHTRLSAGFDANVHRGLVRSNWLRTVGWTARGVLAAWMCFCFMR